MAPPKPVLPAPVPVQPIGFCPIGPSPAFAPVVPPPAAFMQSNPAYVQSGYSVATPAAQQPLKQAPSGHASMMARRDFLMAEAARNGVIELESPPSAAAPKGPNPEAISEGDGSEKIFQPPISDPIKFMAVSFGGFINAVAAFFTFPARDVHEVDSVNALQDLDFGNLSSEEETLIDEIFPNLKSAQFKQGSVGNCYLLAYLYALARKPYARNLFARMIKPEGDGWTVTFADDETPIKVTRSDLKPRLIHKKGINIQLKSLSRGDLGFQIIEYAYAKRRKDNRSWLETRQDTFLAGEGGLQSEVSLAIMGKMARSKRVYLYTKKEAIGLLEEFEANINFSILNVGTRIRKPSKAPSWFVESHMYTVVDYNSKNKALTISNPHDSTGKVFNVSVDDFLEYFDIVEYETGIESEIRNALGNGGAPKEALFFGSKLTPGVRYGAEIGKTGPFRLVLNRSCYVDLFLDTRNGDSIMARIIGKNGSRIMKVPSGSSIVLGRTDFGDDRTVSARHLKLESRGKGSVAITDLESKNGLSAEFDNKDFYRGRLEPGIEYLYNINSETPLYVNLGPYGFAKVQYVPWFGDLAVSLGGSIFASDGQDIDAQISNSLILGPGEKRIVGREMFGGVTTISREHLFFENRDGRLVLKDLNSTNGTMVR